MPNSIKFAIAFYFLIGVFMVFTVLPFESPDENHHLDYVNFVAENLEIPNQAVPEKRVEWEGGQPPLYYVISSIFVRLFDEENRIDYNAEKNLDSDFFGGDSTKIPIFIHEEAHPIFEDGQDKILFYTIRLLSVIFGGLNLYFIWKIAEITGLERRWQFVMTLFVALLPQYAFISASVNSDLLADLLATISIYFIFKILNNPAKWLNYLFLGLSLGIGLETKKYGIIVTPAIFALFLYLLLSQKVAFAKLIRFALLFALTAFLIGFWFYLRNYFLYGSFLGLNLADLGLMTRTESSQVGDLKYWAMFSVRMFISFYAVFCWMNARLPAYAYALPAFTWLAAFIGVFAHRFDSKSRLFLIFALIISISCLGGVAYFNTMQPQSQGRYLFPALSTIALLFTFGLKGFFESIPVQKVKAAAYNILIASLFLFNIYACVWMYRFYQ